MKKTVSSLLLLLLGLVVGINVNASSQQPDKMQWWKDAKFGMFIHWGIYSVPAGQWGDYTGYGEWIMLEASIQRATYAGFAKRFNPSKFDAEEWVRLAKAAGQKYIVITAKHHDGFAMFDSKASDYNVVKATPFKRDVIAEIAAACRKYDMKLGLYYSQAQDWYHPGGARYGDLLWDIGQQGDTMEYVKTVALPQVKEILSQYGDIAILWWDTPLNLTTEMCEMLYDVASQYPNLILNNRLGSGPKLGGDIETPEQAVPATGLKGKNWEVCMTMNEHWGYNAFDEQWKSTRELLHMLIDIVSKGGNFLLNVGPTSEGVIPPVCQNTLREMGEWLDINGEAIYGTTASPFPHLSWGRATRKGQKLYLHVFDWKSDGKLELPLKGGVRDAYLLADKNHHLKMKATRDGLEISLPAYAPDRNASVIVLDLTGEPVVDEIPSLHAVMKVDGEVVSLLNDEDNSAVWKARDEEREATVYVEFPKEERISALSFIEPWEHWSNRSQEYDLQYLNGSKWVSACSGKTDGTGITVDFKGVRASRFRLILKNADTEPSLKELILYR